MANQRARRLRSDPTEAEKKLWWRLRALKRDGFHFRRQVPIDHLIVDFACYSARLVIEVDGGQHNFDEGARRDRARDANLRNRGFQVLRFWNNDVLSNTDGVEGVIRETLVRGAPTPNPSPQQGVHARLRRAMGEGLPCGALPEPMAPSVTVSPGSGAPTAATTPCSRAARLRPAPPAWPRRSGDAPASENRSLSRR